MATFQTNYLAPIYTTQLVDVNSLFINNTTTSHTFKVTDPTFIKKQIVYSKPTIVRTSDITATIDGVSNNGSTVFTFGPSQYPMWVGGSDTAVGASGNSIVFSNDGINWNGAGLTVFGPAGSAKAWTVCYSGTIWVAGAGESTITNTLAYSYNGINWTGLGKTIFSSRCQGIGWNGTMFVATGIGTNSIAYSYDGINWIGLGTGVLSNTSQAGYKVKWNGYTWIAVGANSNNTGGQVATSTNGINWVLSASGIFSNYAWAIEWNGTTWLLSGGGSATTVLAYNTNFTGAGAWTPITLSPLGHVYNLAWGNNLWIVGQNTATSSVSYTADPTGITGWISLTNTVFGTQTGAQGQGHEPYWNGSIWVFVGLSQGAGAVSSIATSYNGINWITLGYPATTSSGVSGVRFNNQRPHSITFPRNLIIAGGQGTNSLASSVDGITWTGLGVSTFSNNAAFGNYGFNGKVWVAGGDAGLTSNTLAWSTDGITWNGLGNGVFSNRMGCGFAWNGYTWLAGGFSPNTNTMAFSQDGITWNPVPNSASLTGDRCWGFAWNGSIWVAAGGSVNTLLYTSDPYGKSGWIGLGKSIFSTYCFSIKWNGSMFVAGGIGRHSAAYSYNGIDWKGVGTSIFGGSGVNNEGRSLDWNGTMWVMTGGGGTNFASTMIYSFDGINWSLGTNIFTALGYTVAWTKNKWVAGGNGTNSLAYSYNGITWVGSGTGTFSSQGMSLAYSNALPNVYIQHPTIIGGESINTLAYSPDGIQIRGLGNTIFSTRCYGISWNGIMWVAVGQGTNTLAYSYDGIQWDGLGLNIFTTNGYAVTWNGSLWVATGQGTTYSIAYSRNGIQWTGVTNSKTIFTLSGYGISWNGLYWVCGGEGGNSIATSSNGTTWAGVTGSSSFFTGGTGVATNGSLWVMVGYNGGTSSVYYTTNVTGTSGWTAGTNIFVTAANVGGLGIAWNGIIWVAVGNNATVKIATSINGTVWTAVPSSASIFSDTGFRVCWNGVRWVAAGNGINSVAYSQNGKTWYGAPGSTSIMTIAYGVCSNPQMGAVVVDSTIVLNNNGYNSTQTLDIVADSYYQSGYNNMRVTVSPNNQYPNVRLPPLL